MLKSTARYVCLKRLCLATEVVPTDQDVHPSQGALPTIPGPHKVHSRRELDPLHSHNEPSFYPSTGFLSTLPRGGHEARPSHLGAALLSPAYSHVRYPNALHPMPYSPKGLHLPYPLHASPIPAHSLHPPCPTPATTCALPCAAPLHGRECSHPPSFCPSTSFASMIIPAHVPLDTRTYSESLITSHRLHATCTWSACS